MEGRPHLIEKRRKIAKLLATEANAQKHDSDLGSVFSGVSPYRHTPD